MMTSLIGFGRRQEAMILAGGARKPLSRPCPSPGTAGAVVSPLTDFRSQGAWLTRRLQVTEPSVACSLTSLGYFCFFFAVILSSRRWLFFSVSNSRLLFIRCHLPLIPSRFFFLLFHPSSFPSFTLPFSPSSPFSP